MTAVGFTEMLAGLYRDSFPLILFRAFPINQTAESYRIVNRYSKIQHANRILSCCSRMFDTA